MIDFLTFFLLVSLSFIERRTIPDCLDTPLKEREKLKVIIYGNPVFGDGSIGVKPCFRRLASMEYLLDSPCGWWPAVVSSFSGSHSHLNLAFFLLASVESRPPSTEDLVPTTIKKWEYPRGVTGFPFSLGHGVFVPGLWFFVFVPFVGFLFWQ